MKTNRLSQEKIHEVCLLIQENQLSLKEISELTGVAKSTVSVICNKKTHKDIVDQYDFSGRDVSIRRITKDNKIEEVCQLLQEGKLTRKEIMLKTGVSIMVIKNIHKYHSHQDIASKFDISKSKVQTHNLTPKDKVIEICELLQNGSLSMKEISIKVGVSNSTVSAVYHNKIYKDITKSYNFNKIKSSPKSRHRTPFDTVRRICEMLQEGKLSLKEIMIENKVSISVVKGIYSRSTYQDISAPYDFSSANVGKMSKTSPGTVHKICALLQEGNMTRKEIAMVTNTSLSIIDHIYARRTYKSISREYNFK